MVFNLNDDVMTIEEWNYTRIWVDEYIQYLDLKAEQVKPLMCIGITNVQA